MSNLEWPINQLTPSLHVFGLWEGAGEPGENPCRETPWPGAFLLWCDSANHCTTVPPHVQGRMQNSPRMLMKCYWGPHWFKEKRDKFHQHLVLSGWWLKPWHTATVHTHTLTRCILPQSTPVAAKRDSLACCRSPPLPKHTTHPAKVKGTHWQQSLKHGGIPKEQSALPNTNCWRSCMCSRCQPRSVRTHFWQNSSKSGCQTYSRSSNNNVCGESWNGQFSINCRKGSKVCGLRKLENMDVNNAGLESNLKEFWTMTTVG